MNPSDATPGLEALISRYFDDQLTSEELATLEHALQKDPGALALYCRVAQEHSLLSHWGRQVPHPEETNLADQFLFPPKQSTPPPARRRLAPVLLALAACVAFAFVLFHQFSPSSAHSALAHLDYSSRSTYGAGNEPTATGEFYPGTYELRTGMIRFETRANARVTIQAPARFELVNAHLIRLHHGKIAAWMLNDAASLTIRSGEYEITDLGTSFGLDIQPDQPALVSVFDGAVTVSKTNATSPALKLTEGKSATQTGHAAPWQTTHFSTTPFTDLWPLALGINDSSSLVRFVEPGPLPKPLRDYQADTHLFLIPEAQHIDLPERLRVNLQGPGQQWPLDGIARGQIEAATRVSSYLLMFNPLSETPTQVTHLSGSITFAQPILGVICGEHLLADSDQIVGLPGTLYGEQYTPGTNFRNLRTRRLEASDQYQTEGVFLPHDELSISADGRTLHFAIHVRQAWEHFRVLVATPDLTPAP